MGTTKSETTPPSEQAMWMPALTDHHRKLTALAGSWAGEETLYPSPWMPEGGTAEASIEAKLDVDGFFLLTDYVETRGGRPSYRGHGVFGWDTDQKKYSMFWFDSVSPGPRAPVWGTWDGDTLAFESASPMGHQRYVYVLQGPDRYTFRIEMSRDGTAWQPFVEGRYTRR